MRAIITLLTLLVALALAAPLQAQTLWGVDHQGQLAPGTNEVSWRSTYLRADATAPLAVRFGAPADAAQVGIVEPNATWLQGNGRSIRGFTFPAGAHLVTITSRGPAPPLVPEGCLQRFGVDGADYRPGAGERLQARVRHVRAPGLDSRGIRRFEDRFGIPPLDQRPIYVIVDQELVHRGGLRGEFITAPRRHTLHRGAFVGAFALLLVGCLLGYRALERRAKGEEAEAFLRGLEEASEP